MMEESIRDFLPTKKNNELRDLVFKSVNISRTSFQSGPQANVEPLRLVLTADAKSVRSRLRNYSQEQRVFLPNFFALLDTAGDLFTLKHQFPMPYVGHELAKLSTSRYLPYLTYHMGIGNFKYRCAHRRVNRLQHQTKCTLLPASYMESRIQTCTHSLH